MRPLVPFLRVNNDELEEVYVQNGKFVWQGKLCFEYGLVQMVQFPPCKWGLSVNTYL